MNTLLKNCPPSGSFPSLSSTMRKKPFPRQGPDGQRLRLHGNHVPYGCRREAIARISREVPDMLVGAGTLLTPEQVEQAPMPGPPSAWLPVLILVVKAASALGFPFVPGVSTASEMSQALSLGCLFQKILPGGSCGRRQDAQIPAGSLPAHGRAHHAHGRHSCRQHRLLAEIPEVAACGGSWICEPSLIQSSEWEEIGRRTWEALRAL